MARRPFSELFPRPCDPRHGFQILADSFVFGESVAIGTKPSAPAFVEPERPAPPKPEPENPSLAALRLLREDREARLEQYERDAAEKARTIENLESALIKRRADLDHTHDCMNAIGVELKEISIAEAAVRGVSR